jgi:hypothetical protein
VTFIAARDLADNLVMTLKILACRATSSTLRDDIRRFALPVLSSDFDVRLIAPLLEQIVKRAPDEDIWKAFITLVKSRMTPPITSNKVSFDTPFKVNTSSQRGSEQTHDDLDPRTIQEINGCFYKNTEGFYEKYFEEKPWSPEVDKIVQTANPKIEKGRWPQYPHPPSQKAFLDWFEQFQRQFFQGGRGTYVTSHGNPLGGSDCKRKPDLFLMPSETTKRDAKYTWKDVWVIAELKQSKIPTESKKELVWFCELAREVFKSQPIRRFLHGFIIRGSMIELWVFDRSGLYSCKEFDIHKDPHRFIRVMAGYTFMSNKELGMDTYVKVDKIGKYIMFKGEDKTERERLYLEDKPIASQRAIVCRGTTCYRAKRENSNYEFVVKFSWRAEKRTAEGSLLKLAKDRKVWGVARLFGHEDLEEINDLRDGMTFGKPQKFRSAMVSESQALSLKENRKRSGEIITKPAKRSRTEGSSKLRDITNIITAEDDRPEGANRDNIERSSGANPTILESPFDNRILSCLVVSPPGRSISKFDSVKQFLEAFRDFIKAHRSLLNEGRILHRDISENNVIITDAGGEGDPRGMLIDLDLAKNLDDEPSGARYRTGTMQFMAIGVLNGEPHTYRHDLESIFYVFLWTIILYPQQANPKLPTPRRLQRWYEGGYQDIADVKQGHMSDNRILDEFPPRFAGLKELAKELRQTLFPMRHGLLFTGTYVDSSRLYNPMIGSFEKAIANIGEEL